MGAKDVSILVNVQAEALFNGGDILDNCQFEDDNNGGPKRPLKEFKTVIFKGKFLTWEVKLKGANENNYKVTKIRITFKDISPFEDLIIENDSFKLKEKIKDDAQEEIDYKYEFQFFLRHAGNTKWFAIDPLLRINPQPLDPS